MTGLVDRGLDTTRSILVVIDGAKALAKSVRDVFGKRALIQRCQVHKRRNVLDSLPERMRDSTGSILGTAYRCKDAKRALDMLNKLARQLERKHPGAAASLREGLEETLTVLAFKLGDALERTLARRTRSRTSTALFAGFIATSSDGRAERWFFAGSPLACRRLPLASAA